MRSTGLVYHSGCLKHLPHGTVPEVPERVSGTYEHFKRSGLLDKLKVLTPERASEEDILRVHTVEHLNWVKDLSANGYPEDAMVMDDYYVGPETYGAAMLAAGGTMLAVKSVLDKTVDNAFALIRPPGHHASSYPSGFCYFNNIAVAIRYAQRELGAGRVTVFDWDVHAGNGTMKLFYDDPSVLTISAHRDPGRFYPGDGFTEQIGEGEGRGYCMNIPLSAGAGDADYAHILDEFVAPTIRRYKPGLIIVAAGQDSHAEDPLGGMKVTDDGFAAMSARMVKIAEETCDGRLVMNLEGGYNLAVLPRVHTRIVSTLLGMGEEPEVHGDVQKSTTGVLTALRRQLKGTLLSLD